MVMERQKKRNGVYIKFIHSISDPVVDLGEQPGVKKKKEGGKNSL